MKAVLISIRPKWVEKIASGEKALEVRKTRPKLETPFKCYIYCTEAKKRLVTILKDGDENYGEIYHGKPVFIKVEDGSVCDMCGKRQKIVGEFVCDTILPVTVECSSPADLGVGLEVPGTCLTDREILDYLGSGKQGYLWHISDLKLYSEPKELTQFDGLRETRFGFEPRQLERPPQSWCYVEG